MRRCMFCRCIVLCRWECLRTCRCVACNDRANLLRICCRKGDAYLCRPSRCIFRFRKSLWRCKQRHCRKHVRTRRNPNYLYSNLRNRASCRWACIMLCHRMSLCMFLRCNTIRLRMECNYRRNNRLSWARMYLTQSFGNWLCIWLGRMRMHRCILPNRRTSR